jgi:hypothetical protein
VGSATVEARTGGNLGPPEEVPAVFAPYSVKPGMVRPLDPYSKIFTSQTTLLPVAPQIRILQTNRICENFNFKFYFIRCNSMIALCQQQRLIG